MHRILLAWIILLAGLWWWFAPDSPRVSMPVALGNGEACRFLPPLALSFKEEPLQTPLPVGIEPLHLPHVQIIPLAGFSVNAKVLSRENYRFDKVAAVSHVDLALGWGAMAEEMVSQQFKFRQSKRYGYYRWRGNMPLPQDVVIKHFGNVHLIPSTLSVARDISKIKTGDIVRIDGWLVQANHDDGWLIRSSLSREDTGVGACEVIWVCSVSIQSE